MPDEQDPISRDPRFRDLGMSGEETQFVKSYCRRYVNIRDGFEDIVQEALIGLASAFRSQEEKGRVVKHRRSFIRAVVRNTLYIRVIRKNSRDAIYKAVNTFAPLEELCGVEEDDYFQDDPEDGDVDWEAYFSLL